MDQRTHLIVSIAAIVLVASLVVVTLAQCETQLAPTTGVPAVTTTTEETATLIATPDPTPTLTDGERAAAAVGRSTLPTGERRPSVTNLWMDESPSRVCGPKTSH